MPFDPNLAITLARFAWDAYNAYWSDEQFFIGYRNLDGTWQQHYDRDAWLRSNGYQLIVNPNAPSRDQQYFGIVGRLGDAVVVAFRGTDTWNDIAIDAVGGGVIIDDKPRISFPFSTWTVGSTTVWAHSGFLTAYQGLQTSVRATVKTLFDGDGSLAKLYVTGHSLGGALATLCAIDLANALAGDPHVPRPRLWTYASPCVGDQALATLADSQTLESYRLNQYSNDWVTWVPSRGWTPAWMQWYNAGRQGPEPSPKFVAFVHVGTSVLIQTAAWFPSSHLMTNYYLGCQQLLSGTGNPLLPPDTAVTSLTVRIKTRDSLGAGTDNDVFIRLMGVTWGPLDNPGNDFEQGSIGTYDLFATWPEKIPPNPKVRDLTSMGLHLGDGIFYFSVYTMAWDPEWVEITVNGIVLTQIVFISGTLTWSTSRDVTVPIHLSP